VTSFVLRRGLGTTSRPSDTASKRNATAMARHSRVISLV
jgi:hypothetical protein